MIFDLHLGFFCEQLEIRRQHMERHGQRISASKTLAEFTIMCLTLLLADINPSHTPVDSDLEAHDALMSRSSRHLAMQPPRDCKRPRIHSVCYYCSGCSCNSNKLIFTFPTWDTPWVGALWLQTTQVQRVLTGAFVIYSLWIWVFPFIRFGIQKNIGLIGSERFDWNFKDLI